MEILSGLEVGMTSICKAWLLLSDLVLDPFVWDLMRVGERFGDTHVRLVMEFACADVWVDYLQWTFTHSYLVPSDHNPM